MDTAVRTARTSPASWDAFTDVDAFVDEVLAELAAMEADGTKPTPSGPKPTLIGAVLRKAIMAIQCLGFCGMQWRTTRQLCDIPFNTLFSLFARWIRLGLWRRLLDRWRRTWRLACVDTAEPIAVVIDSRSCRSAPSYFDGDKKINGAKSHRGVEKHGIPLAIDVSPANVHDTKGILPVIRELSGKGFRGSALGDLGYSGKQLVRAVEKLGITIKAIARGHDSVFLPTEICWTVERSFSWIPNYRRLNTIFERTKEHLVAFIEIAFVYILSRRIKRLVTEEVCA